MKSDLEVEDWYTITGCGQIAVVDTRKFSEGRVVHVGDVVRFVDKDGNYKVTGIEGARYLTDPSRPAPSVGLRVRLLPTEKK